MLGDYIDRGPHSKKVLDQIVEMKDKYGIVVLGGNHDQMMIDSLAGKGDALWMNNGGYTTTESYVDHKFHPELFYYDRLDKIKEFIIEQHSNHVDFLNNLPYFHETKTHIFVHAGINPLYRDWKSTPDEDFIWIRKEFYLKDTNIDKVIVFGHTPCVNLHGSADIWFCEKGDKIGIDGACAYGKQLNCLEISNEGYKTYSVKSGEY